MALVAPDAGWGPLVDEALAGAEVPARSRAALGQLLDLVLLWNRRVDLTAARSPDELVDLFVADAAMLASVHPPGPQRWVDVGSGAGAPGLGLAVLRPELELTLVEPRAKRVAFLHTALGTVGRANVRVHRARSEQLASGGWEVACSRAALPPSEWLRQGTRLATRGVWVLLARAPAPSLAGWRAEADVPYTWPLTGAARRAVRFVPDRGGDVR